MTELIKVELDCGDLGNIILEIDRDKIEELYEQYVVKKGDGKKEGGEKEGAYEAFFPINLSKGKLRITLPFNSADPPYSQSKRHFGLDVSPFAGASGQPMFAMLSGKVYKAVHQNHGYGNYIVVESHTPKDLKVDTFGGGVIEIPRGETIYHLYAHASKLVVGIGKQVKAGQILGLIGTTGFSSGPHVHYEIRVRDYDSKTRVDPLQVLEQLLRENAQDWYFLS